MGGVGSIARGNRPWGRRGLGICLCGVERILRGSSESRGLFQSRFCSSFLFL